MSDLAIQKVYNIKTVGVSDAIDSFEKLNQQFDKLKKNKIAMGDLGVGDNGKLLELNEELKSLTGNAKDIGQIGTKAFRDIAQSMEQMNGKVMESIIEFTKFNQAMSAIPTLAKDISDANRNMASSAKAYTEAENKQSDTTAKLINIQAQYGKSISENAANLAQMKVELTDTTKEIANCNKMIEKQVGNVDDNVRALNLATLRQQELRVEISATTAAIKTEVKEVMAASGSMDEMAQALGQLREQRRALSAEERNNPNIGGVVLSQITVLDEELKMLDAEQGINIRNVGDYSGALQKAGLNAATLTSKLAELKAAGQEDTAAFQQMNAELDMWNNKIAKFSMSNGSTSSLGATTFSPTFQGQLKEVRTQMNLIAAAGKVDSDEFRVLALEAQRLSAAMAEVNESIKTVATVGDKFTAILEKMGLRMIANLVVFQAIITAFTALWDWFTKLTDAEQRAKDKLDAYNSALEETIKLSAQVEAQIAGGIGFDNNKAQIALKIANDHNKSIQERILAYQDLQGIMPDIFKSLTDEQKKTGEFTADMNKANAAIRLQNELKAAADVLQSKNKAFAASTAAMGQFQENYRESLDPNNAKNFNPTKYKNELISAQQEQLKLSNDLNAAQKKYNDTYEKYNALKIIDDKNTKEKTPSILAGINELYEARKRAEAANAEAAKQQFELQASINKAVYEDDKNALQIRLDAYNAYQQAQIQIATIDSAKEIAIAQDKLNSLLEKEKEYNAGKIKLSKDALAALKLDEETYTKEITTKRDGLNIKLADIQAQGLLGIASINKSDRAKQAAAEKEYYTSEQTGLQDRLSDFENSYNEEATVLANSYLNKEISEKEFQKRLKKLKNDFDITTLTEKIAQDTFSLNDEKIKDAKQLEQIKSRLTAEKKALTDAQITKVELDQKDTELNKTIRDGAFEVAQEAEQQYFQMMQRRFDLMDQAEKRALDYNKKQTDSQVQSNQQKIAADKAYDLAQQQLEKDKLRRQQQLAKQQMAMDYALAVMKIWSVHSVDVPIAIAETAVVTGVYGAKLAAMTQYGDGGDVPSNGGVFGGRSHSNGGTPFSFGGRTSFAEADELAIINKRSASSNRFMSVSGTPKQIASGINAFGGGKNFAPGAIMHYGYPGTQGAQLHAPSFITNQQIARVDEMQAAKVNAVKADQTHAMIMNLAGTVNELAGAVSRQSSMQVILDPHSVTDFQSKHSKSVNVSSF